MGVVAKTQIKKPQIALGLTVDRTDSNADDSVGIPTSACGGSSGPAASAVALI